MSLQWFPVMKAGLWGGGGSGGLGVGIWKDVIAARTECSRGGRRFKISIAATEMHSGPL